MKKPSKTTVKSILLLTLFYIVISAGLLVLIDQNVTQLDTNRVLSRAQRLGGSLKKNPMLTFNSDIERFSTNVSNQDVKKILDGAIYSREMTRQEIKVTIPILKEGKITSYLSVTDTRSPIIFINTSIIIFCVSLWFFSVYGLSRRAYKRTQFTSNIVAKIKNIERSPLTQSYLITKDDDPITIALNGLGEDIQRKILSNREAKENLYEFIEFFQFPIFVYDGMGAFHRSNAAFQNEFPNANSVDAFSSYSEFLNFLVEKIVHPDIQNKTFYFERINSYYQVQFNPLEMLNNRYLVAMYDVSNYYQMVQSRTDFITNMSLAIKSPIDQINISADKIIDIKLKDKILKETKWLGELINDSVSLTSPSVKNRKVEIHVNQIIEELLDEYKVEIAKKKLYLSVNLSSLVFKTDEQRLRLILNKLIGNAVYYSIESGKIEIDLVKGPKNLQFTIRDSGPGLTELQQARVFENFYQADENFSNLVNSGLGLAIVKKNVEDLKGHVKVSSQIGVGSTFILRF